MPGSERETSCDRQLRHQHSWSVESGRSSVPMWDSSDPERAPPPLPLNPGSSTPGTSPTKGNTSATVAAAAQALVERARESNNASNYVTNPYPERSPERNSKTPQHKRLQSLQSIQSGVSGEYNTSLETASEISEISRPGTPQSSRTSFVSSPERSHVRSGTATPTPGHRESKDALRPSARAARTQLLRENTPPSATMLAIQNMKTPETDAPALGDITNASIPAPKSAQNFDSVYTQMLNLTTIATALQKEMAALSRRSKDNATDLNSLKDATKTRDEDIRKSLRELVANTKHSEAVQLLEVPKVEEPRPDTAMLQVMLAQLQIKIEAMDQTLQSQPQMPSNTASAEDIDKIQTSLRDIQAGVTLTPQAASVDEINKIQSSLRDLQAGVAAIAVREANTTTATPSAIPNSVSKDDIDALETLLQNTKAKIDERVIPGIEATITREHLDGIEAVVRMTNDAVEGISARVNDQDSSREDLPALTSLVREAATSLNEAKDKLESIQSDTKATAKGDFDAVEELCGSIKSKLEEMPGSIPSKADIEELNELLQDFRESHDQMKESYEGDISTTAKAFDDRRNEARTIMEQLDDLKSYVGETRDHLETRMKRGNDDVRALDEILQTMEQKIDSVPDATPDIDDLKETIASEFEKAHESIDQVMSGHKSSSSALADRVAEQQSTIVAELVQKLDDRFNEVMSSHEEQKQVLGHTATSINEKSIQQDELLAGSQAMAEDLKVTIDTLGASVTAISPALAEATGKMADDSKMVFSIVDEMSTKIDDANVDSKTNHQLTRDEVIKTLTSVTSVHEELNSNHPQVMDAIKVLLAAVEQHFEYTKASQENTERSSDGLADGLKAHFDEGLKRLPLPQIDVPHTIGAAERQDDWQIHSKLDDILNKDVPAVYDDTKILTKLDSLIEEVRSSEKSAPQSGGFEEIREQLSNIPGEISSFVTFQTQLLSTEHTKREKEASEAALDLQKSVNEKTTVESDISVLKQARDGHIKEVETLQNELEQLNAQKIRLSADVSSLETAMRIRREELHMMDSRADALERRIIEGVMDHSRALLIAKTPRTPTSLNPLKRVGSNQSTATTMPSVVNNGIGMAMKTRTGQRKKQTTFNSPDRRIASLGQITGNTPTGGKNMTSLKRPEGMPSMKRSQSTRTPKPRKQSWNPSEHGSLAGFDKENDVLSEESDEEAGHDHSQAMMRASSYAGTRTSDGVSSLTRRTSGATAPSEYLYGSGTGSYLTGSDVDRRSSYGSTIRSGPGPGSSLQNLIHEEEEYEDGEAVDDLKKGHGLDGQQDDGGDNSSIVEHETESESHQLEPMHIDTKPGYDNNLHGLVLRNPDGYDSGLGSDLPTAAISVDMNSDYFKTAAQAHHD